MDVYSRDLGGIQMEELGGQLRQVRELVGAMEGRDLQRGFTLTLLLLVAVVWLVSLVPLLFMAHRISRPIQQLTAGLTGSRRAIGISAWPRRATTKWGARSTAFNDMAEHLRRNRERLVYLTQISSWQTLARKTAHELKNSLTPIRLTVEEMVARQPQSDRAFMQQAAQIVVGEIETLERRVRAFSEFASEPPVNAEPLDVNAIVSERVSLLRPAHPETTYRCTLDAQPTGGPCQRRPGEGHPDEPAGKRRRGGGARRHGGGDHAARTVTTSRSRCTTPGRASARKPRDALRADDHVQEARDGARALDCQEERAAHGRRHRARRGRARRRRLPGDPSQTLHDQKTPDHRSWTTSPTSGGRCA